MKKISIIIPNWNGIKFLKICLDSIKKQTYNNYEVIIVDNGSTDNSILFIKKHYPWVKLIKLDKNIGFSPAVNLGIKSSNGELIALINNDLEMDINWLKIISDSADKYPEYGFFACKMLDFKHRNLIDSCGDAMSWSGRSWKLYEFETTSKITENYPVFGACAGAAVYRKKMLDKIGLFDEDFFAYLEDVDLDFRAQLAGYKCLFIANAIVYHIGSGTSGKRSGFSFELMIKNHYHLIYKNFPTIKLFSSLPKLLYSELRLFIAAIKYKFLINYLRGLYRAFKEFPRMIKKRKQIQSNIKVDTDYLNTVIYNKFPYGKLKKYVQ